ncbi:MAG: 4-hydroxy-tetrahydrodipicolinate synthase [Acetobacteraceae bacterium]|nr:4-hydroxy-tetrahydrodipicolinate synthase [Acetobacteraceae bacterium]
MASSILGLHGSVVDLPTPFRSGTLDEEALTHLVEQQVAAGTTALIVCSSTGEATTLTEEEYARAVRRVAAAALRRVPVIAGCEAPTTAGAVRLAELAMQCGADALLCTLSPDVASSQGGIVAHVYAVAHASGSPIVMQDAPGRGGVGLYDATIARLYERDLVAAVKDATLDLSRPARLRAMCGAGLIQLTADDATAVAYRAAGGHGCISASANVAPKLCTRLHLAWAGGHSALVAQVRDQLQALHAALLLENNPIPLKAALTMLGLCSGDLRLPLTRATLATCDRLADVLPAVMAAEDEPVSRPWLAAVH